jgi:hypothetical protein
MTHWGDLPREMRYERIDEHTMDRLLRGRMAPDDAPPGYADVAVLLRSAASLPSDEERETEIEHVASARAVVGLETARRPRTHRLTAALVLAGALAAVPALAAANVLPDGAQHAFARVLDKVGISVPDADEPATDPAEPATEPAADHPASTGTDISSIAKTTDEVGVAKGAAISSVASGGMSQAGQHGRGAAEAGTKPPATIPNSGGTGTGHTASGGSAETGTTKADESSGGRSQLGSGNAQAAPAGPGS